MYCSFFVVFCDFKLLILKIWKVINFVHMLIIRRHRVVIAHQKMELGNLYFSWSCLCLLSLNTFVKGLNPFSLHWYFNQMFCCWYSVMPEGNEWITTYTSHSLVTTGVAICSSSSRRKCYPSCQPWQGINDQLMIFMNKGKPFG